MALTPSKKRKVTKTLILSSSQWKSGMVESQKSQKVRKSGGVPGLADIPCNWYLLCFQQIFTPRIKPQTQQIKGGISKYIDRRCISLRRRWTYRTSAYTTDRTLRDGHQHFCNACQVRWLGNSSITEGLPALKHWTSGGGEGCSHCVMFSEEMDSLSCHSSRELRRNVFHEKLFHVHISVWPCILYLLAYICCSLHRFCQLLKVIHTDVNTPLLILMDVYH